MNKKNLELLDCPICRVGLVEEGLLLRCLAQPTHTFEVEDDIVKMLPLDLSQDVKLSQDKWGQFYEEKEKNLSEEQLYEEYRKNFFDNVYRQVNKSKAFKDSIFLEIGCGPFILGQMVANECKLIVGIDFSLNALRTGRLMLRRKGIENFLLIWGDILQMPIKENAVDLLYGGGVMEHFKDTQKAVNEFYRVLKPSGVTFNAVPYLNLAALTYRQIYGNIPNFPIVKQLAEFLHIKILKSRHMIFGYELSFIAGQLINFHKKAGFPQVQVEKFDSKLFFDFIPFKFLRPAFRFIADNFRLFWPMVKVTAIK